MTDKRNLSDYQKEEFTICKGKAEVFFDSKKKTKAYWVKGYNTLGDSAEDEREYWEYYLILTDEQVEKLKDFIVTTYNKAYPGQIVESWTKYNYEVLETIGEDFYDMMNEMEGPWKEWVANPLERASIRPILIDFDRWQYCYSASLFVYDDEKVKMEGPFSFPLFLTNDESVFLLALQLHVREGFTYNGLWEICPELAYKIHRMIIWDVMDQRVTKRLVRPPYVLILNEVVEDSKSIN